VGLVGVLCFGVSGEVVGGVGGGLVFWGEW